MAGRGFTPTQEKVAARIVLMAGVSLYDVLDVDPDASQVEVVKAYKKQALKLHPDKNSAPSAEAAMRAVNQACEILGDPVRREWYDSHGAMPDGSAGGAPSSSFSSSSSSKWDSCKPEEVDKKIADFIASFKPGRALQQHREQLTRDGRALAILVFGIVAYALAALLLGFDPSSPDSQLRQSFSFTNQSRAGGAVLERHFTHGPRVAFFTAKGSFKEQQYPLGSAQRKRIEAEIEMQYRQSLLDECIAQHVAAATAEAKAAGVTEKHPQPDDEGSCSAAAASAAAANLSACAKLEALFAVETS